MISHRGCSEFWTKIRVILISWHKGFKISYIIFIDFLGVISSTKINEKVYRYLPLFTSEIYFKTGFTYVINL